MNRYRSIINKESWVVLAEIIVILFWWYHNPYLLDKFANVLDMIGVQNSFSAGIIIVMIFALPLAFFLVALRHDSKIDALPKDEREQQNELKISEYGYLVCSSGVTTYLVLAPYQPEMIWLWGVLVLTFLVRLMKRFELEKE
jgi:hypothetical protein